METTFLEAGLIQRTQYPVRYTLAAVTREGQQLPNLDFGVVRRLDRLDVDGLLGLDFLRQFAQIHFDTRTLRLVLQRS